MVEKYAHEKNKLKMKMIIKEKLTVIHYHK